MSPTVTLRAYRVRLLGGRPQAYDHAALRWVGADELAGLDWVPADRAWLTELSDTLRGGELKSAD